PTEFLQHSEREFGVTILDLGILGIGSFSKQVDLHTRTVRFFLFTFDTEACTETATSVHDREVRIVEEWRSRVFNLGRAPAWPPQAVVVAFVRTGGCPLGEHAEVRLVRHVRLDALR